MTAFLWTMVVFGVLEFAASSYFVGVNKLPKRTPGGAMRNAVFMLGLAMWAFWLLATGAA